MITPSRSNTLLVLSACLAAIVVVGCKAGTPAPSNFPLTSNDLSVGAGKNRHAADMVSAHNQVRRSVGVPGLEWSEPLASQAQQWANRLQERGCAMEHSHARGVGENLAWASGKHLRPADVVTMWADEARNYDLRSARCASGAVCGHYTQVVWKNTSEVGCGLATCGRDEIWVCNYSPPGNYTGQRPF